MKKNKKYRPSNGSEGDWFMESFCIKCKHEYYLRTGKDNARQCKILDATMMLNIDNPQYPKEWTYDDNDNPICTKFNDTLQKRKSGKHIKEPNLFTSPNINN
jgi:hypothetical protein